MLSGLDDSDVLRCQAIATQRGATILVDESDDFLHCSTSHLVTRPRSKRGIPTKQAKRTLKYFAALLRGNWIVSDEW